MKTVWFEVQGPDAAMGSAIGETRAGEYGGRARITFRSAESMARVMTPTRWTLIQMLIGAVQWVCARLRAASGGT
jgi:predicted transcriptional regulator